MMLPLVYHREAREDIDRAYGWYEQQRDGLGEEFLSRLQDLIERIQRFPELYGIVYRTVRAGPLRRFPYVVFYRAESDRIVVLGVEHGKQRPHAWRSRL